MRKNKIQTTIKDQLLSFVEDSISSANDPPFNFNKVSSYTCNYARMHSCKSDAILASRVSFTQLSLANCIRINSAFQADHNFSSYSESDKEVFNSFNGASNYSLQKNTSDGRKCYFSSSITRLYDIIPDIKIGTYSRCFFSRVNHESR